jgi:membrane protein implicated in regulation of membrane protease activity
MPDWLTGFAPHWFWLTLAAILGAAEMLAPGFFLIWLAMAAAGVGMLAWLLPVSIPLQVGMFAIASILAVYAGKKFLKDNPIQSQDPMLNDRGARLTGEVVTVVEAIADGSGRVKVGDTVWNARGIDAQVGARVRVTGANGAVLNVEPVA